MQPLEKHEVIPRTFEYGNTKVIIHSNLAWMNQREQTTWFRQEWEKRNPVLMKLSEVLFE